MTSKQLEVVSEDLCQQKWCVPLKEDVFAAFMAKGGTNVDKVFGDGSLFSPFLFRKFFDPSDAFPLWEFEPGELLFDLQKSRVDWLQTDTFYVLKAELPKLEKNSLQISVEKGKVVEISGQWKHQGESKTRDWRSGQWWQHGFVRRLELPENVDWKKIEAYVNNNDLLLDIRLPKTPLECDIPRGHDGANKEPVSASA